MVVNKESNVTAKKSRNPGKADAPAAAKPRRSDPSDNKMRGYRYVWEVYPDYWKASWGEKPLLGYVRADSEFNAQYAAYDKKLLPLNFTFGPEVRKATKFIKDI